jgi:hypothetical protein
MNEANPEFPPEDHDSVIYYHYNMTRLSLRGALTYRFERVQDKIMMVREATEQDPENIPDIYNNVREQFIDSDDFMCLMTVMALSPDLLTMKLRDDPVAQAAVKFYENIMAMGIEIEGMN